MSAPRHRKQQPRHIFAARAAALRAEGLNGLQIAQQLGIGKSYAYELLTDPSGELSHKRKLQYYGACDLCGSPTSYGNAGGSHRHCATCIEWTRESVIAAFEDWFEEHGTPPRCVDTSGGLLPSDKAVKRLFGSWNDGLEAAGLPVLCDKRPATHAAIVAAIRAGEPTAAIADRHGVSQAAIQQRFAYRKQSIRALRSAA